VRVAPDGATQPGRAARRASEREVQARVHRQMGITAAVMGVAAAGVGFWWIGRVFGVGPLEALQAAWPLFLLVLVILALGMLLSLGAARAAWLTERFLARRRQRKVDSR
jgi:apolipoprotein N-acyltransferase